LRNETKFLEIVPEDCALSFEVANIAERVYTIDVFNTSQPSDNRPQAYCGGALRSRITPSPAAIVTLVTAAPLLMLGTWPPFRW